MYSRVFIVIDALDECTNRYSGRTKLVDRLDSLQNGIDVSLMVTSRFILETEQKYQVARKLEVRASDHDVRCYSAGQIPRLPIGIQHDEELETLVQNKIAERVDGM
jgi:hypothetical protein